MTIMTHKDCEEWAAMIAQMQDDPSYHPVHNKKGEKPKEKEKVSLEEQVRVYQFRNAKLHLHNQKIEKEILELRKKVKELEAMQTDQFRNKGDM